MEIQREFWFPVFIRLKYSFRTLTQLIQILMAIMHDLHPVNYIEMSFQCVFTWFTRRGRELKSRKCIYFQITFPPSNIIKIIIIKRNVQKIQSMSIFLPLIVFYIHIHVWDLPHRTLNPRTSSISSLLSTKAGIFLQILCSD